MSLFVTEVKTATAMQQTDINKISENVLIPLLAEVYGYKNLKNLNFTEGSNFPGVDLGDETARVAFQITATPGIEKVKHTLNKFIEYKLYEKYDRLIIYILTEKQNTYSDKEIKRIIQSELGLIAICCGNFIFTTNSATNSRLTMKINYGRGFIASYENTAHEKTNL
jgi:hypothetical protein